MTLALVLLEWTLVFFRAARLRETFMSTSYYSWGSHTVGPHTASLGCSAATCSAVRPKLSGVSTSIPSSTSVFSIPTCALDIRIPLLQVLKHLR